MKLKTIALATAFAVSSTFALAQAGGSGSGAQVPEKSGAAVNGGSGVVGTTTDGRTTPTPMNGATTGTTGSASKQGSPTAGSAEKAGNGTTPGGTMAK
jgi:hypothetical protein